MQKYASCPYCGRSMRVITHIRATEARSYFLCDSCGARSPRARHRFIDAVPEHVTPTWDQVPKTIAFVEDKAFELANRKVMGDDMDLAADNLEDIFQID